MQPFLLPTCCVCEFLISSASIFLTNGTIVVFAPLRAAASLPAFLCKAQGLCLSQSLKYVIAHAVPKRAKWKARSSQITLAIVAFQ